MSGRTDRQPTLKDVARLANTSIKSVSRVVNDEGNVSAELRDRVHRAIDVLGYRRDEWARRLRSGQRTTGLIGLIVVHLGDPFYGALAEGVMSVASERGVMVVTASTDGSEGRQNEAVDELLSRRVDGLVIVPVGDDVDLLEQASRQGTGVVFVDLMPARPIGDVVLSDHKGAARMIVDHLLSGGHRRIGFLGLHLAVFSMKARYEAYEEALAVAGVPVDEQLVATDLFWPDAAAAAVDRMLDLEDPPTAFFAAYRATAIGAIRCLQTRGLQHDVALVSFDDLDAGALLSPGLTATPQDPFELGRAATELLFQRLDGHDGPFETLRLTLTLEERGSGEIRPADARSRPQRPGEDGRT